MIVSGLGRAGLLTVAGAFRVLGVGAKAPLLAVPGYPVDGHSTPQGVFAFAAQPDERKGVGAWMELKSDSVAAPAKSEQKVSFRITVPLGTEPGDFAGGLIIQASG